MYVLEVVIGWLLWWFWVVFVERWISVYGKFVSMWFVYSGVFVEDGVVYVVVGMIDFDGTYVYVFDVLIGKIKW